METKTFQSFHKVFPYSILKLFILLFYLFLERGVGREKDRERNINVWLPLARPLLGTWPATQTCALTGNQTSDLLICRPSLNHWATLARVISLIFSLIHSFADFGLLLLFYFIFFLCVISGVVNLGYLFEIFLVLLM